MAVDYYKSKQIARERMGWRSKKYLYTKSSELALRADDYAAKGWLEKQSFGDMRKIPNYRLTPKGKEAFMAKGSRLKWVPGCFESEHQHTLDRTRQNLNKKGWYSSKDVIVDEKLIRDGHVEEKVMTRGYRRLTYFRVTEKGRLFLRQAIPQVFLKRCRAGLESLKKTYRQDLKNLAKTYRQDIASVRSSMKSRTKEALSAMDVGDFSRYGISGNIRKFRTDS
jgi:DNA-binding PadR family transcriptional regulator